MIASFYKCSNSKSLVISDKNSLEKNLGKYEMVPCVALITAWRIDIVSSNIFKGLILFLLEKGCEYFICVGTSEEHLHDFIDDLFLDHEEVLKNRPYSSIVTT